MVRLRWWNSARDQYVEPTVRWYRQTAADFYQPWVANAGAPEPYVSADSRLAALHALTYGVKYGMKLSERLDGWDTTIVAAVGTLPKKPRTTGLPCSSRRSTPVAGSGRHWERTRP